VQLVAFADRPTAAGAAPKSDGSTRVLAAEEIIEEYVGDALGMDGGAGVSDATISSPLLSVSTAVRCALLFYCFFSPTKHLTLALARYTERGCEQERGSEVHSAWHAVYLQPHPCGPCCFLLLLLSSQKRCSSFGIMHSISAGRLLLATRWEG
jgi:hypothetical protein